MRKIVASILVLVLCISALVGCAAPVSPAASEEPKAPSEVKTAAPETQQPEAAPEKGKELFIGLSLPTQSVERWVKDGQNITAECEKRGIKLAMQMANDDAGKQVSQCENLISQGVNVLIVAPHDGKAAAAIVELAHAANVPVISYVRLILDSKVDYCVADDSLAVGQIQGEYITKAAPKGKYVILSGDPTDNNAKLFKEGAMQFIQPLVDKGDIVIVTEQAVKGWDPANALKIMEDSLTANKNDIQGIICPNDATAGACIEAMAVQGMVGVVPISGGDCDLTALQRIAQGTQSMTVFKDLKALAKAAVDAAEAIFAGEEPAVTGKINNGMIDVPSILIKPELITKDNIDSRLISTGEFKKEDVYK